MKHRCNWWKMLPLWFCWLPLLSGAQVRQAWVARYNGPANGEDGATALAVDKQGNVYVTGDSLGLGTSKDYATVKYDANGNQLWVARYNGPGNSDDLAHALAVDSQGSVYVTGGSRGSGSGFDYATVKYDSNGNLLWVDRYNGTSNGDEIAYALAVDSQGNVYVTGSSWSSGSGFDYATVKYDPNGNRLWTSLYNGIGNGNDIAYAIAVDSQGNVYVTGSSWGSGTRGDYVTVKYDASGNPLWVARYNGPANGEDAAYALVIESQGRVYVTGYSTGSGTAKDYATVKYDVNGNLLWVARYDGPGSADDWAYALTLDSQGNLYVTGYSATSGPYVDYATLKYDPSGNLLWVARYDGPGSGGDEAYVVAVDTQGGVYVTGDSLGSGTAYDYGTVKYDANGNLLWVARYNGPSNSHDKAITLALDNQGNVYVTGWSRSSTSSYDYATVKYIQSVPGDVNWDGCVNDQDLQAVLLKFGQTCNGCPEDLNGDGAVNDSDLSLVLQHYGEGC